MKKPKLFQYRDILRILTYMEDNINESSWITDPDMFFAGCVFFNILQQFNGVSGLHQKMYANAFNLHSLGKTLPSYAQPYFKRVGDMMEADVKGAFTNLFDVLVKTLISGNPAVLFDYVLSILVPSALPKEASNG